MIFLDRSAKSVHAELQKARSKWNPVAYKTHFICWVMVCGDLRVNCEDVKATCGAFEAEVSLTSLPELTAISNIYPPCYEKKKKKKWHITQSLISPQLSIFPSANLKQKTLLRVHSGETVPFTQELILDCHLDVIGITTSCQWRLIWSP